MIRQILHFQKLSFLADLTQVTFTCSKSTIKTLEKGVKYFSRLTIKALERRHCHRSAVFIVNFEHISHFL